MQWNSGVQTALKLKRARDKWKGGKKHQGSGSSHQINLQLWFAFLS